VASYKSAGSIAMEEEKVNNYEYYIIQIMMLIVIY